MWHTITLDMSDLEAETNLNEEFIMDVDDFIEEIPE